MAKIHGRNTDIYFEEFDLNADMNNVVIDTSIDTAEVTSFGDTYKEFVEGVAGFGLSIDAFWNGASDAFDEESFTEIAGSPVIVSVFPESDTIGNKGYSGHMIINGHSINAPVGGAVTLSVSGEGHQELSRVTVLDKDTMTADGQSASTDFGAAGSSKITGYLHVTAFSGFSNVDIAIQESSDNGAGDAWADAVNFTAVTGVTSERKQSTSAGERYLRVDVDVTGTGSITFLVAAENK